PHAAGGPGLHDGRRAGALVRALRRRRDLGAWRTTPSTAEDDAWPARHHACGHAVEALSPRMTPRSQGRRGEVVYDSREKERAEWAWATRVRRRATGTQSIRRPVALRAW